MLLVFTGPETARSIADTGQTCPRGRACEVRDDVAERLLAQASWRQATDDDDPTPEEAPAVGGVPGGNVDAVLDWVGDDPDRARQAIEAEREQPNPRSTLITTASQIIDAAHQPEE